MPSYHAVAGSGTRGNASARQGDRHDNAIRSRRTPTFAAERPRPTSRTSSFPTIGPRAGDLRPAQFGRRADLGLRRDHRRRVVSRSFSVYLSCRRQLLRGRLELRRLERDRFDLDRGPSGIPTRSMDRAENDDIFGNGGADDIGGGDGDDTILIQFRTSRPAPPSKAAYRDVRLRRHRSHLGIRGARIYDFTVASIDGIERLAFSIADPTAILDGDQIGGAAITEVARRPGRYRACWRCAAAASTCRA